MKKEIIKTEGISYYQKPHIAKKDSYLVIADLHIRYHNKQALNLALERLPDNEGLILLGDIVDFGAFMRWTKRPEKLDIFTEIKIVNEILNDIRSKFKGEIIYKYGNHEKRFETFIFNNAPFLWEVESAFIEEKLNFNKFNITKVDVNQPIRFSELNIIHGHEIRATTMLINVARTYFLKANANILLGHWHVSQDYIVRDIQGKVKGAWAIGCLCDLYPEYNPLNQHVHGFAEIEKDRTGFEVFNRKIINNKVR